MITLPEAETPEAGAFETATRAVLNFVRQELDLEMALLSRRVDDDYLVLVADDVRGDLHDGDVFAWEDTFCARVVDGRAPMIAPRVDDVPAFVEARAIHGSDLQSYVGVPITGAAGDVIAILCGGSSRAKSDAFAAKLPVTQLLADLLGGMLRQERELAAAVRTAERAQVHASTDSLTGLGNRRHWDTMLTAEAERFRRYGSPYAVIMIDLDGLKHVNDLQGHAAGDELICLTAEVLTALVRPSDTIARLGGDEFVILAVECDRNGAQALSTRLDDAFAAAGLRASAGMAVAAPNGTAAETVNAADRAMYESKRANRALAGSHSS